MIDRIPLVEKLAVWLNKSSDFMWQPTSALPELSIFTHRTLCNRDSSFVTLVVTDGIAPLPQF